MGQNVPHLYDGRPRHRPGQAATQPPRRAPGGVGGEGAPPPPLLLPPLLLPPLGDCETRGDGEGGRHRRCRLLLPLVLEVVLCDEQGVVPATCMVFRFAVLMSLALRSSYTPLLSEVGLVEVCQGLLWLLEGGDDVLEGGVQLRGGRPAGRCAWGAAQLRLSYIN